MPLRLPFPTLLAAALALACVPAWAADAPTWSNYGPAEREFDVGFVMFAEHHDGAWHAWVPSYWGSWSPLGGARDSDEDSGGPQVGQVLDFFSGKVITAILEQNEMGHARPRFTTFDGVLHSPDKPGSPGGMRSRDLVHDWKIGDLAFASYWQFDPPHYEGCDTSLTVVEKLDKDSGEMLWNRLILDYSPPSERCPHGYWESQARAVLDLQDGTFLIALSSKVVRLSFADLSPVGTGATVRIVDADLVQQIIDTGGDIHEGLNKALSTHD